MYIDGYISDAQKAGETNWHGKLGTIYISFPNLTLMK